VTVQAVGAIASATNALAQDFTQEQTLDSEAQELRAWLGRAADETSITTSNTATPSVTTRGQATGAPTEMQTLLTPNAPPTTNGKMDMFM
jgi:hypothetical protein